MYSVVKDGEILSHFGIFGQKWGIRRWQYSDGSLTPQGRVHYGVGPARGIDKKEARQRIKDYNRAHGTKISPRKAIIKKGKYYYNGNGRRMLIDDIGLANNAVGEPPKATAQPKNRIRSILKLQKNHSPKMGDVTQMSLEELREQKARLDAEQGYMESFNRRYPKAQGTAGRIKKEVIAPALTDVAKQATKYAIGNAVNDLVGKPVVNVSRYEEVYDPETGEWKIKKVNFK